jgi:hypothetical protein
MVKHIPVAAAFMLLSIASAHFTLAATKEIPGREAAAIALAVKEFTKLHPKTNFRYYTVELERRGDELDVTFVAERRIKAREAPPLPPSPHGPDMRYVVSLKRQKIVTFNYFRD